MYTMRSCNNFHTLSVIKFFSVAMKRTDLYLFAEMQMLTVGHRVILNTDCDKERLSLPPRSVCDLEACMRVCVCVCVTSCVNERPSNVRLLHHCVLRVSKFYGVMLLASYSLLAICICPL
jgi:hypothetical protein